MLFTTKAMTCNPKTEEKPFSSIQLHIKMNSHRVQKANTDIATTLREEQTCKNPSCFFCIMKEQPGSDFRRAGISNCFKNISLVDDQQHVLVLSGLWNIAMAHPDDPEFPFLGVFSCMASLITRGANDRNWLHKDQNIYIPYYAAHVIGSYTMNKPEFAERAVEEGVISPLLELMRGKMTWVEQRVAVRALGHLASYTTTFNAIAEFEEELVALAMHMSSTCLETVYVQFVSVKGKRMRYHCDLLTRGVGGFEIENRKAEEWASQLQCWSIYILNCFASKERSLNVICGNKSFLKELCKMWGAGLMNHTSPAGVGLIRILCYSKIGRKCIAETKEVVESLCNLSRSSDDWQYMAIDCLLLLLQDQVTRHSVFEIATLALVDLVELRALKQKSNIGQTIARTLLSDYVHRKSKIKNAHVLKVVEETKALMVDRKRKENTLSIEKVEERRVLVNLIKQQGNSLFWSGEVEQAKEKYCEGLNLCPLKLRKERMVLYSNRAQCHLVNGDTDAAISDCTRALCLSNPVNSHSKSLWRRSQAYDMKGLAQESLLDCVMFVNGFLKAHPNRGFNKLPYYAARMISKHMDSTWLFANVRSKIWTTPHQVSEEESEESDNEEKEEEVDDEEMMEMIMENKDFTYGLSTILEEPVLFRKGETGSTSFQGPRTRNKQANVPRRSYKL